MSLDESSKRRGVLGSFWAIFLLGLPMWYLTTRVSRTPLPELPAWPPLQLTFPLAIDSQDAALSTGANEAVLLLNAQQSRYRYTTETDGAQEPWRIQLSRGTKQAVHFGPAQQPSISMTVPSTYDAPQTAQALAELMQSLTAEEAKPLSADLRVVNDAPQFNILYSLMNGGGRHPYLDWPIEQVLQRRIEPVLVSLQAVSTFVVESQVQHYAELTVVPSFDTRTGEQVLSVSDLSNFINAAEWPLATAEGDAKPLNLLIYVPAPSLRPLVIKEHGAVVPGNAFLLPQFGSVVIYNPPANETATVMDEAVLEGLLKHSTGHLLTLLGLGTTQDFTDLDNTHDSRWRRDALYRRRLLDLLTSAQTTLASIPTMVDALPNMHVPARVATRMQESLLHIETARRHGLGSAAAYDLVAALQAARKAVSSAESAFFDDKMVSLLYFPQEHKYGVYMPLFGPLLLPMGLSLLREIKGLLVARRGRRAQAAAKKVQ